MYVGKWRVGSRKNSGDTWLAFADRNNLTLMNGFFCKKGIGIEHGQVEIM